MKLTWEKLISYLLICLAVELAFAQNPQVVYVKVSAVNVRSGPGLKYKIVGVVTQDTPVKVISKHQGWFEILVGDTLDGWIDSNFTMVKTANEEEKFSIEKIPSETSASETISPTESSQDKDKSIYRDGDMKSKIKLIIRLSKEHSGPAFDFLQAIMLNHKNYDLGKETDLILLPEIFQGWRENKIVEATPILLYVMQNDLSGEIGNSPEAMKAIRHAAKEAIKILTRI
jgi:uncharacterized protein YgiM (DUF1202 family)